MPATSDSLEACGGRLARRGLGDGRLGRGRRVLIVAPDARQDDAGGCEQGDDRPNSGLGAR